MRAVRRLFWREQLLGPARRASIQIGRTTVSLGGTGGFPIDWQAFVEIFADEPYATDYAGANVLDIGGHKGYFGAYALARRAMFVVSVEPADENYDRLAKSAARAADGWRALQAAVGDSAGAATLHLAATSWAHSLHTVDDPVGAQSVAVITLTDALALLPSDGTRTIVKIDAEGSECDILADAGPLGRVDVLFVEWHDSAACSRDDLVRRVAESGLSLRHDDSDGILCFER
jgi:FkbM family methyltransferase